MEGVANTAHTQVLNHAALISWKQLDPVQFDGEICLCRTIPFPFSLSSNLPDACPSSATVTGA